MDESTPRNHPSRYGFFKLRDFFIFWGFWKWLDTQNYSNYYSSGKRITWKNTPSNLGVPLDSAHTWKYTQPRGYPATAWQLLFQDGFIPAYPFRVVQDCAQKICHGWDLQCSLSIAFQHRVYRWCTWHMGSLGYGLHSSLFITIFQIFPRKRITG